MAGEELDKYSNNSGGSSNSLPSEFKDPFVNDAVDSVTFRFRKWRSMLCDNKFHEAVVYLKNGNTSGKQEFYDDDPENLRRRVDEFIKSLE